MTGYAEKSLPYVKLLANYYNTVIDLFCSHPRTCCKLIEHIISKHIRTYIERNELFDLNQHGFRATVSVSQLVAKVHDFAEVINI